MVKEDGLTLEYGTERMSRNVGNKLQSQDKNCTFINIWHSCLHYWTHPCCQPGFPVSAFFFTETQKQYWWYSETGKLHLVAHQRKVWEPLAYTEWGKRRKPLEIVSSTEIRSWDSGLKRSRCASICKRRLKGRSGMTVMHARAHSDSSVVRLIACHALLITEQYNTLHPS